MISNFQPLSKNKMRIFGKEYVKILTEELVRANKVASGKLLNSVAYELKEEAQGILFIIKAEPYIKWVDEGRKPGGKYVPIQPLIQWARIKGLPEEAAWGIRKNIWKFGIRPTNILEKTERRMINNPKILNEISEEVSNQFIKMINQQYKEL